MSNVSLIKLPDLPREVSIDADWYTRRDEILALSQEIVKVDSSNYDFAGIQLAAVTKSSNEVEKIRKGLTSPYLAAQKKIKEVSDKAREPLEDEKARLKGMMSLWQVHVENERRAAEAEVRRKAMIQAELDEILGESTTVDMTEQAVAPIGPVTAKGTAVSWNYEFQVEDITQVPREWLMLDEQAVRRYAKDQRENACIPGIKFTKTANVRAR